MMKNFSFHIGLERESLRMAENGDKIASTKHPSSFGDPLENSYITMDFAESQLEIATPTFSSHKHALHWMEMATAYAVQNLGKELLWPMSTPPPFDDLIAIADFGNSAEGKKKHLYRRGLKHRFSLEKQLLCGYHYNFSFADSFLEEWKQTKYSKLPTQFFATECYLHIIRNFFRFGWIVSYFFGATPFSPRGKEPHPFATSLRQSRWGYTNNVQQQIALNYNYLTIYIEEIKALTEAICPAYEAYGKDQLSPAILQTEKELYSFIKPKRICRKEASELAALEKEGIEYLEVRLLDLNPLTKLGISLETMVFIKKLLLFCLMRPSAPLSQDEYFQCQENHFTIAEKGLEPGLSLNIEGKRKKVDAWIDEILAQIDLPKPEILSNQLRLMAGADPIKFAQKQALQFAEEWKKTLVSSFIADQIEREILLSNVKGFVRDHKATYPIEPIKEMELSTQVLIHEALLNKIDVEILDEKEHFLKLKKGSVKEIVKNATFTSKDPFVTILMKGNKALTKRLLAEHDLKVPEGFLFNSLQEALNKRESLPLEELVIKPNTTNMGLSIHFVQKNDTKQYEAAVRESFKHAEEIIVEQFIPGDEFRFLVIDFHTIAIAKRLPAHVIGDGHSSVAALIEQKNRTKLAKRKILGIDDPSLLNLILKKGEKLVLRRQSNVSTGGDAIDMTEKVATAYRLIAERAAKALGSKICGVDMIISDPDNFENGDNYAIIELNYNPMLSIHTHPDEGKARDVTTPLFQLLGLA